MCKGLEGNTRDSRGLQGITGVYKGLQGNRRDSRGLQGITGVYKGLQGNAGNYMHSNKVSLRSQIC